MTFRFRSKLKMVCYQAYKYLLKSTLSNKPLKTVALCALTIHSGNEFQRGISRQANECLKQFILGFGLTILKLCPLVQVVDISNRESASIVTMSCVILYIIVKHSLSLRTSKLSAPSFNNLSR